MPQYKISNSEITLVGHPNDWQYFRELSGILDLDVPELSFLIKNYLDYDAVYFDVNANIGAITTLIAKYLKKGFVYAFESSYNYKYLEENIRINSITNAKLFNISLSEIKEPSFKTRYCYAHAFRLKDNDSNVNNKLPFPKLDDIIKKENINHLDFIKIDVDGYENSVLEGSDDLIKKFNPICYVAVNLWSLKNPYSFLKLLCKKFTHLYYIRNKTLFHLNNEQRLTEFLTLNLHQTGYKDNLVCLNGDIELRKKNHYLFYGNELHTQIGIKKNTSIVSRNNRSGCLSYGPYITLSKGIYTLKITIANPDNTIISNNFNNHLGAWDVYSNKFNQWLASGDIIYSENSPLIIEAYFEVPNELNNSPLEIRTFSNGTAIFEIQSIYLGPPQNSDNKLSI